jgi:putative glutamine amidotransferase
MAKINIFHVTHEPRFSEWIGNRRVTKKIQEADLVMFFGGEDIQAELYGEEPTQFLKTNPSRDRYEKTLFEIAVGLKKPILGICRGLSL